MACSLRGLWIFHADADVKLLMSRRFPTVEKKLQRLLRDEYVALPYDEDIAGMFITEILHEGEDHFLPEGIPEAFHEDFRQGSFTWDAAQEAHAEKLWPLGPTAAMCQGKIWPVVFLFKRGFYLVTVIALEKIYKLQQVRALELPQITAAFSVLEDICEFIPASLNISDIGGISELQYYIRNIIPFGSPINANHQLLRTVRPGFPNKEEDLQHRCPAWKPCLWKGKSRLTLSIVEAVTCTLYGKDEYEDECFVSGSIHCVADLPGVPEICVPVSFPNDQDFQPEVGVHNCAQVVGGVKALRDGSLKISCAPPTGPFALCHYRYPRSPVVPLRGFYQLKEMAPVEFRLLLQVMLHPRVANAAWTCQVRLGFYHRGAIKSHDLKCTGGSFSLVDSGQAIVWNLNVRRPRGTLEANLLGELVFEETPQTADSKDSILQGRTTSAPGPVSSSTAVPGGYPAAAHTPCRSLSDMSGSDRVGASRTGGLPPPMAGGMLMGNRDGESVIVGSPLIHTGGLMHAKPSTLGRHGTAPLRCEEPKKPTDSGEASGKTTSEACSRLPSDTIVSGFGASGSGNGAPCNSEDRGQSSKDSAAQADRSYPTRQGSNPMAGALVQDPFLHGVNCYAEVFFEVSDFTLSGIQIDPKAVTIYPSTRVHGGVAVQREVLTGRYLIWNMAGEVRGHRSDLLLDDPATP